MILSECLQFLLMIMIVVLVVFVFGTSKAKAKGGGITLRTLDMYDGSTNVVLLDPLAQTQDLHNEVSTWVNVPFYLTTSDDTIIPNDTMELSDSYLNISPRDDLIKINYYPLIQYDIMLKTIDGSLNERITGEASRFTTLGNILNKNENYRTEKQRNRNMGLWNKAVVWINSTVQPYLLLSQLEQSQLKDLNPSKIAFV